MKFTDEELSRILSEHEVGRLDTTGSNEDGPWCVAQVAYNEPNNIRVCKINHPATDAFTFSGYDPEDSVEYLLTILEEAGVA